MTDRITYTGEYPAGEVSRFYGFTYEWWEEAIKWYRIANPSKELPDPFFPKGFWKFGSGPGISQDEFQRAVERVLVFWYSNPSQAEMLIPNELGKNPVFVSTA